MFYLPVVRRLSKNIFRNIKFQAKVLKKCLSVVPNMIFKETAHKFLQYLNLSNLNIVTYIPLMTPVSPAICQLGIVLESLQC